MSGAVEVEGGALFDLMVRMARQVPLKDQHLYQWRADRKTLRGLMSTPWRIGIDEDGYELQMLGIRVEVVPEPCLALVARPAPIEFCPTCSMAGGHTFWCEELKSTAARAEVQLLLKRMAAEVMSIDLVDHEGEPRAAFVVRWLAAQIIGSYKAEVEQ